MNRGIIPPRVNGDALKTMQLPLPVPSPQYCLKLDPGDVVTFSHTKVYESKRLNGEKVYVRCWGLLLLCNVIHYRTLQRILACKFALGQTECLTEASIRQHEN